ncbi:MBL fold metallo-hydrolase [bacterium]|nr:MBL fold metallo-hydrolase [bacterium]
MSDSLVYSLLTLFCTPETEMKVRRINAISFEISTDDVTVATDPLASVDFGTKFPKTEVDLAVFSQKKLGGKANLLKGFEKLVPKKKSEIFEVNGAGEFEISQLLIQRPIGTPYYIFDSGYSRIVYVGLDSKGSDLKVFKDLGNVDVLIAPVGNGEIFLDYDLLGEIISEIEPGVLVPYGFKSDELKGVEGLKSKEEFMHHFGYSNPREEKTLKVTARIEEDESAMEIVFLN